jgi:hypothetical protein
VWHALTVMRDLLPHFLSPSRPQSHDVVSPLRCEDVRAKVCRSVRRPRAICRRIANDKGRSLRRSAFVRERPRRHAHRQALCKAPRLDDEVWKPAGTVSRRKMRQAALTSIWRSYTSTLVSGLLPRASPVVPIKTPFDPASRARRVVSRRLVHDGSNEMAIRRN